MSRHKNNPSFNPALLEAEVLKIVVDLFNDPSNLNHDINFIADELQISDLKARKLLITAGERDKHIYYSSPLADQVQRLRTEGKTVKEIEQILQISHASVIGYLPISRTIYGMRELSADAIRVQRYRERQALCSSFMTDVEGLDRTAEEEYLWNTLAKLSGCVFRTSGRGLRPGLKFRYKIDTRKDGRIGGEMKVSRKEKSITRASVMLAYWKVKGQVVPGPKAIGGFGASYLYPVFLRLGVCRAE